MANEMKWAAARLLFYTYIGFSMLTVVGGYLTAPVMTWYFFGDWRFWRHINPAWKLFFHGWKMLGLILKGDNGGFMLSVPLAGPPVNVPLKEVVHLHPSWKHGASCGQCTNCCSMIGCPVLSKETGLCLGYKSFFWSYFNCGRFPSTQPEIDYYECPKWLMNPALEEAEPEPESQAALEALPAGANK